ncbi:uncharacterized protein ACDP82_007281 [Pangshura tecta]
MESSSAQVTTHSSSAQVTMQSPENQKRAPAWTAREVLDLITIWGEDSVLTELRSKRRNEKVFERISKAMMDKGHSRDSVQCRVKIKELRQAYQKTKEANGRSSAGPKTCCFYAELHAILGGCATSSPPRSLDSDVGVVIAMAEDDADREEYDEEADEDDLAESTQHSVSPNSQELFLTQRELASQPSQDNEAMEDTSAANFSSLPTPSQRLSKIRRRKKKMREEMFSDIMEVTRKERAHLNEWKEVVSKIRKDASEREDRRDTQDERWQQEDRQEDQWWRQEDQRWRDATLGLLRCISFSYLHGKEANGDPDPGRQNPQVFGHWDALYLSRFMNDSDWKDQGHQVGDMLFIKMTKKKIMEQQQDRGELQSDTPI